MPEWWDPRIGIYLLAISLLGIGLTILDKRRAKRRRSRMSEATLFTVALMGGAAAMYLAMVTVRHKTKKPLFMWGLPLMTALHIAGIYWWIR